jgi:hypothetical protein
MVSKVEWGETVMPRKIASLVVTFLKVQWLQAVPKYMHNRKMFRGT